MGDRSGWVTGVRVVDWDKGEVWVRVGNGSVRMTGVRVGDRGQGEWVGG